MIVDFVINFWLIFTRDDPIFIYSIPAIALIVFLVIHIFFACRILFRAAELGAILQDSPDHVAYYLVPIVPSYPQQLPPAPMNSIPLN